MTDTEEAEEAVGANEGNTISNKDVTEALVAALNERSGLGGRRIEPVYFDFDLTSASYESQMQAACEKFGRDEPVQAFTGTFEYLSLSFLECMGRAGIPVLKGDHKAGDIETYERFPGLISTAGASVDRRSVALLDHLSGVGFLSGDSRIGVLVEGCPHSQRGYERSFVPTAERLGLTIADTVTTSCLEGLDDLSSIVPQLQSAVLRFRSANVDRVAFVADPEALLMVLFSRAAESQTYRPGYALTSVGAAGLQPQNSPPEQLRDTMGVGWMPTLDVAPANLPSPVSTSRRCVELLESQGVRPQTGTDLFYAYTVCDPVFLYETALGDTAGNSDAATVINAIERLGTSYVSTATVEGATRFGANRHDGPAAARVLAFDADCTCFKYVTAPNALP